MDRMSAIEEAKLSPALVPKGAVMGEERGLAVATGASSRELEPSTPNGWRCVVTLLLVIHVVPMSQPSYAVILGAELFL